MHNYTQINDKHKEKVEKGQMPLFESTNRFCHLVF